MSPSPRRASGGDFWRSTSQIVPDLSKKLMFLKLIQKGISVITCC